MLHPVTNAVRLALNGVFLLFSNIYTVTGRLVPRREFIFVLRVVVS